MSYLLFRFHFKALSSLARHWFLNVLRVRLRHQIPRRLDIILELKSALLMMLMIAAAAPACAKPVCVETEGESALVRGDLPSAKMEALSRAKWSAVEQVAGVELKSRTLVTDSVLLEDLISSQARGVVTSLQVINEQQGSETVRVRVKACVEPSQAREAVSPLALHSTVAVFVPSRKLSSNKTAASYDDSGPFTEAINNALIQRGFTVKDLAEGNGSLRAADLERAMKSDNFLSLRSLAYRYKSNTILIGRIEPTLSTSKGDDVGYGINMPFNKVTVRLTYRLLTRDGKGNLAMLAAGTDEAVGLAPHVEDARNAALKNLAEKTVPVLMDKINLRMKELAHKVIITVAGVNTPEETFAARDQLQQITWVSDIEDEGIGRFRVTFPENPLYLANGLTQKGFRIISFARDAIKVRRR